MRNLICRIGLILQIIGLLALGAVGANSQVFSGGLNNGVIFGDVGISGQVSSINVAGRFSIIDVQAFQDPNVILPDLFLLPGDTDIGIKTLGTYATIRIDGGFPPNGATTQPGWDLIVGDTGVNGATNQGAWTRPPTVLGNKIIAQWVTLPGAVATNPIPPIEVNLEVILVHDVACLKFTVVNRDLRAHSVGIRLAQDYNLPGQNDFANYQWGPIVTNDGRVFCSDFDLRGTLVPSTWQQIMPNAKNSITNELYSVGGILIPINAPANFIRPDRFVVGYGNFLANDPAQNDFWNPIPSGLGPLNLCGPSLLAGAATFFSPRQLVPNQSLDFVTYIGKAKSTIDFNPPLIAGVQSPGVVNPTVVVTPGLSAGEFTVQAFVRNQAALPLTNVKADLNLPAGLKLKLDPANPNGNLRQKLIGSVPPEGEASTSWQVIADGTVSGRLTYSVAFVAGPGNLGKVVARDVEIPAIPVATFGSSIQMVSFPFTFDDPTPSVALGLSALDFDLIKWNPKIGQYEAATRVDVGQGYWLLLHPNSGLPKTLNLQGAHPLTQTTPFEIALDLGWNQVGDPWTLPVGANQIQVINTDPGDPLYLTPQTIDQAAAKGWIASTIYYYDTVTGQYKFDQTLTAPLLPFVGYWMKALKPNIDLLIATPVSRAAKQPKSRAAAAPGSGGGINDWKLRIEARTSGSVDGWNFLGVSPSASDTADRWDAEKPPAINNHISLAFVRNDSAGRSVSYAQDLQQGTGGRKQWNLTVTTPKPDSDVTLSWPEFASVPRGYELYIMDTATGNRQSMRQTSSLRVNSGSTSTRSFTITAEPRHPGAFRITNLMVSPTRAGGRTSASIMFNTTMDSNVQVRVMGANGSAIRNLVTRAASAGAMQMTWDYKDNRGVNIPAGQYVIDVKATTSDGQSAHVSMPHVVVR